MDYQKAYALLVGTTSNAIDELMHGRVFTAEIEKAFQILQESLEIVEEMYVGSNDLLIQLCD